MGKNKGAKRALTQEEIWDDSALVQSWDDAVEEYQQYHSIHAKGENVEDVLRAAEAEAASDAGPALTWAQVEDDDMADADAEPAVAETHVPQAANNSTQKLAQPVIEQGAAWTAPPAPPVSNPAFPPGKDEGLKNLMMAWYYAGYYTALYEGQQTTTPDNRNS
ncbi:hypothetical protein BJX99DRAFT_221096 [Aspergillus californicus]